VGFAEAEGWRGLVEHRAFTTHAAMRLRHGWGTRLDKYQIAIASRDWTVETIVRQIEQENIDLDPAFQRRNAWRDLRRSRLIESFILGFPVPQLVLAENPRRRGSFIVIDGKQRLLTIAGTYLPEYRDYWAQPRFSGLSILTELNGESLDSFLTESKFSKERRLLGNADIRTTVISGFTDEDVLYDIFYPHKYRVGTSLISRTKTSIEPWEIFEIPIANHR
jgi:hypothetical protein